MAALLYGAVPATSRAPAARPCPAAPACLPAELGLPRCLAPRLPLPQDALAQPLGGKISAQERQELERRAEEMRLALAKLQRVSGERPAPRAGAPRGGQGCALAAVALPSPTAASLLCPTRPLSRRPLPPSPPACLQPCVATSHRRLWLRRAGADVCAAPFGPAAMAIAVGGCSSGGCR